MYNFIVIEGNIGAGKTSLAKMVANEWNAELLLEEFEDNPFLPEFYKQPEKQAFSLELFFLAERYQQWQDVMQKEIFQQQLVADYMFIKSLLFASITLTGHELSLYRRFFHIIANSLPKPDILFYLHCPVEQLMANISSRGRDYEQSITVDYLQQIEAQYFSYFKQIQQTQRVVIIKSDSLDFVHREIDYLYVQKIMSKEYPLGVTIV